MPSARSATTACTVSGRSAGFRQARAIRAIAAGSSRPSGSTAADPARGQRAGQGRGVTAFVPEGGDAQYPFGRQVVGQVLEQRQRLPVGPVQVLQDEHAAGLRGQHAQQPQHRLAQEDKGLLPRRPLRWPPLGNQPGAARAGTGQASRWPAGGCRARRRSAPQRTAGTASARPRHGPADQYGLAKFGRRAYGLDGPAATSRSRLPR